MVALERACELLDGRTLNDFGTVCDLVRENLVSRPGALTAVDTALHDVYCKSLGISIVQFLGRRITPLPTSVTIGIKDDDEVKNDLDEYMAKGFSVMKVKIGLDVDRDIRILRKIREWGGSTVRIRVDGNQGYSPADLMHLVSQTSDADLEFIEQPFMAPALSDMRVMDADLRQFCMADEDLLTLEDALALSSHPRPYGSWNIKLMKSGGITTGKWIGDLAGWHDIPLMWGCMDESKVSIAASLHTAYSCRTTRYLDLDGSLDLAEDIVSGGFNIKDGVMYLTDEPGLGVKLKDI